jgi:hypothetical protein
MLFFTILVGRVRYFLPPSDRITWRGEDVVERSELFPLRASVGYIAIIMRVSAAFGNGCQVFVFQFLIS